MTKAEAITKINQKTGINRHDVQLVIESLFSVVKEANVKGETVHFRGFGSFGCKKRNKKIARNIARNTAMVIEAHYIPRFNPAKAFVASVKKNVSKGI